MPTLVIANKLYSSWSLRPWLLMKELGLAFNEVVLPLGTEEFRREIQRYSPAGKVPVLIDRDATVWESLAIMDYVSETLAPDRVWPRERSARAQARAISAEMHAGFAALRNACPMNLGRKYPYRDRGEAVARDVARIQSIFAETRRRFGKDGPFLFGQFSAADAMFAPVATRFDTYSIPLDPVSADYRDAILGLPSFREWREAALQETWVIDSDEIDETPMVDFRKAA